MSKKNENKSSEKMESTGKWKEQRIERNINIEIVLFSIKIVS